MNPQLGQNFTFGVNGPPHSGQNFGVVALALAGFWVGCCVGCWGWACGCGGGACWTGGGWW